MEITLLQFSTSCIVSIYCLKDISHLKDAQHNKAQKPVCSVYAPVRAHIDVHTASSLVCPQQPVKYKTIWAPSVHS